MKTTIQDKTGLVNSVFSKVYKKYDLMNDIMSLGVHRIWKTKLIDWMSPQPHENLIDVASGTGDIAKLFSKENDHLNPITCVEPNEGMYNVGKSNLKSFKNIKWCRAKAEKLPFDNDIYDFYTISYGIMHAKPSPEQGSSKPASTKSNEESSVLFP